LVVAVHPTELYETALMLGVCWWLWRRREHGHGTGWLFGWYLVLAGAERFLIEIFRAKDDRLLGNFTLAQATSVGMVLLGAYLLKRWSAPETAVSSAAAAALPPPKVAPAS
jgi:phosphatidylglycerol:prolipoprotein diacylglycerol transferase